MTLQQDVDVLRKIPLFAKIEPATAEAAGLHQRARRVRAGEPICRQGEPGDAAYIVLEGSADVVVQSDRGPMKVATVGRNDIVGEIAILCDVPRTATVLATTPLVALRVSKDGFFNLVTQFPQVGVEVMHELASRLHQTTQRLTEASTRLRELERAGLSRCRRRRHRRLARRIAAPRSTGWCARPCGQPFLDNLFGELCERLRAEGVPLTRATMHLRTLHPQFQGARVLWRPGMAEPELSLPRARHVRRPALHQQSGAGALRGCRRLPPAPGSSAGRRRRRVLRSTPICATEGYTDYVALPMQFTDGKRHATSWSTDRPGGFSTDDLVQINDLLPVLAMAVEIRSNRRITKNLLNTYVGQHAGDAHPVGRHPPRQRHDGAGRDLELRPARLHAHRRAVAARRRDRLAERVFRRHGRTGREARRRDPEVRRRRDARDLPDSRARRPAPTRCRPRSRRGGACAS